MESALETRIQELLETHIKETDLFLVDVKVSPNFLIRIYVDGDSGVNIAQCTKMSRYLEFHLESEELVPEQYTLEVSSPGLDMPLKLGRQFKKNVGRVLSVKLADGSSLEGILKEYDENLILIEGPKGEEDQRVEMDNIIEAKVKITIK